MAKLLLVEDDVSLREIYAARLQAEGYEVVAASDGEEALAMAVKEKPDLVMLDIMMPKISGFDVLDILRSTPETKHAKIIMMTALSQQSDRDRGEKLGADEYLIKSQVTLEDVVNTIKEQLSKTEVAARQVIDNNLQPENVSPPPVLVPGLEETLPGETSAQDSKKNLKIETSPDSPTQQTASATPVPTPALEPPSNQPGLAANNTSSVPIPASPPADDISPSPTPPPIATSSLNPRPGETVMPASGNNTPEA